MTEAALNPYATVSRALREIADGQYPNAQEDRSTWARAWATRAMIVVDRIHAEHLDAGASVLTAKRKRKREPKPRYDNTDEVKVWLARSGTAHDIRQECRAKNIKGKIGDQRQTLLARLWKSTSPLPDAKVRFAGKYFDVDGVAFTYSAGLAKAHEWFEEGLWPELIEGGAGEDEGD